ncbi:Riboflavin synthase alpha chain [Boothiomyces sp. JEL0838]|nr:Riboflavin synthase alpha chain [Boothiomyces sp. JEL0838]KAJ3312498.1 Riboflavin synthase alpha chain [Boothiomyces sp. JEL0838]
MFTGIVETMGRVSAVEPLDATESGGNGFTITIENAKVVLTDVNMGDSIAVNGVCLTVTEFNTERTMFKIGVAPETLRKTNLGEFKVGQQVNLERAMSATTRFGGHFVQGHVDTTVTIHSITKDPPNSLIIHFKVRESDIEFLSYIVPKGYVCLDGTSLTVIDVDWPNRLFSVMLIAYTQSKVIMPTKTVGSLVNLEVDPMGKYVENIVRGMVNAGSGPLMTLVENAVEKIINKK